jgi:hypothetical protein
LKEFDPVAWIAGLSATSFHLKDDSDCRKRVPLEALRGDLRQFNSVVDNQLIDLINKVCAMLLYF